MNESSNSKNLSVNMEHKNNNNNNNKTDINRTLISMQKKEAGGKGDIRLAFQNQLCDGRTLMLLDQLRGFVDLAINSLIFKRHFYKIYFIVPWIPFVKYIFEVFNNHWTRVYDTVNCENTFFYQQAS